MIIQNEKDITDAVCAEMAKTPDLRLRAVMESLVRHLHGFLRETRLTEEEWEFGLAYLTELGRATTPSHNETILAADVLGASSLVGFLNNAVSSTETEPALLGPFWRQNSPLLSIGESIAKAGTPGLLMRVAGRVMDDRGNPIPRAMVDVWQADPRGLYDNQIESLEEMNLRGRFEADDQGYFHFLSVKPAGYPVPTHGPTGALLRAQKRSAYRPAHVHFMVSAPGFKTLVTQVFADDSEHLDNDVTFSVLQSLVATFKRHSELDGAPYGIGEPWCSLTYDLALASGESRIPVAPITC